MRVPPDGAPHAPSPRLPWDGRRIVLGITGGVAAYKAIQLARDLTRLGGEVDSILTGSAGRFVRSLSFSAVTGRPALADLFSTEGAALHIALGREADVICVAPATADFIARAAQGRANDLLTTTLLATRAPVIVCPAMNDRMFGHPQTRANLDRLGETLGYRIAGPDTGPLAFGEGEGPGRMLEPAAIVEHIGRALGEEVRFRGRRLLISAGPTHEPVDPVRYVGNRSSGRMGYALARAAWRRGGEVTLVSGPVSLDPPTGPTLVRVDTAREMRDAVAREIPKADVVILAAAVADHRPARPAPDKIKRGRAGADRTLPLRENPDIALETRALRKAGAVTVGFALETSDVMDNARDKMVAKGFDLIVANNPREEGAGFGVDTNRVTLIAESGDPESLPLLSKDDVAERILDEIGILMEGR